MCVEMHSKETCRSRFLVKIKLIFAFMIKITLTIWQSCLENALIFQHTIFIMLFFSEKAVAPSFLKNENCSGYEVPFDKDREKCNFVAFFYWMKSI